MVALTGNVGRGDASGENEIEIEGEAGRLEAERGLFESLRRQLQLLLVDALGVCGSGMRRRS